MTEKADNHSRSKKAREERATFSKVSQRGTQQRRVSTTHQVNTSRTLQKLRCKALIAVRRITLARHERGREDTQDVSSTKNKTKLESVIKKIGNARIGEKAGLILARQKKKLNLTVTLSTAPQHRGIKENGRTTAMREEETEISEAVTGSLLIAFIALWV